MSGTGFNFQHISHSFVTKTVDSFLTCLDSEPLVGWRASSTRRWWSTTSPSWPCASGWLAFPYPRKKVGLTSVGFKTRLFQCFPRQTFVLVIASNHTVLSQNIFLHFRRCFFSIHCRHCCLKIVLINLSCLLSQRPVSSLLTKT